MKNCGKSISAIDFKVIVSSTTIFDCNLLDSSLECPAEDTISAPGEDFSLRIRKLSETTAGIE